jgi:WD40 repeat protein
MRFIAITVLVLMTAGAVRGDDAPEMVLQLGHKSRVTALTFSPDGATLATSGDDGVKFWKPQSGELRTTLGSESQPVKKLAFSPDGKILAGIAGSDAPSIGGGQCLLWNGKTGDFKGALLQNSYSGATSLAFSPDGKTLALGQEDSSKHNGYISLWDVATHRYLGIINAHRDQILSIAFAHHGKTIATASDDNTVKLWDLKTRRLKRTLRGDEKGKGFWALAFSPDDRQLATANILAGEMYAASILQIWNSATGKARPLFTQGGIVTAIEFTDSQTIVVPGDSYAGGEIVFCNVASGKTKRLAGSGSGFFAPLALSHGKNFLAVASGADVVLWNLQTRKPLQILRGHHQPIYALTVSADGKHLAMICPSQAEVAQREYSRDVRVWDVKAMRLQNSLRGSGPLAFAPVGSTLAMSDEVARTPTAQEKRDAEALNNSAEIYNPPNIYSDPFHETVIALRDADTGKTIHTLKGLKNDGISSLAFAPDGKTLVAHSYGGQREDPYYDNWGTMRLWDVASEKLLRSWKSNASIPATPVAFSPDGTLIANGGETQGNDQVGAIQVWQASSGKLQRTFKSSTVEYTDAISGLAFSPDGSTLVGRTVMNLFCWNVQTGKQLWTAETNSFIGTANSGTILGRQPVYFSPDGQLIAMESDAFSIQLRDARTGQLVREIPAHDDGIWSLVFSPDGRILFSAANDSKLKCWNPQTGALLLTTMILSSENDKNGNLSTQWISFTPDGFYNGSANAEKFIRWRVGEDLLPAAHTGRTRRRPDLIQRALR